MERMQLCLAQKPYIYRRICPLREKLHTVKTGLFSSFFPPNRTLCYVSQQEMPLRLLFFNLLNIY